MFLNLTNHRVTGWSEAQRLAAEALGFGPVSDCALLSDVPAAASTEEVVALAEEIASAAVSQGARAATVAGDYTLTVALVQALEARGVACFAAASERQVTVRQTGERTEKIATFIFVRWRRYPAIARKEGE